MPLLRPLVAVADLHGHADHLDSLVAWLDTRLGDYVLVPLGDYCDNGPAVPRLLDRLIALQSERGGSVRPIVGNHDLACLQSLQDNRWFSRWSTRYWNAGMGTPGQYGAADAESFRARLPQEHRAFLAGLPWFLDLDGFLFVHAGLEEGPIDPQLGPLARKELPATPGYLPDPIRDKTLSMRFDPSWDRVVVSGHHSGLPVPRFEAPNRICLRADAEYTGILRAVVLPEHRYVSVDRTGCVKDE